MLFEAARIQLEDPQLCDPTYIMTGISTIRVQLRGQLMRLYEAGVQKQAFVLSIQQVFDVGSLVVFDDIVM